MATAQQDATMMTMATGDDNDDSSTTVDEVDDDGDDDDYGDGRWQWHDGQRRDGI